ncbi:hypothetical protein BH11ACT3_BH11ACT3_16030 [soil metagenome]
MRFVIAIVLFVVAFVTIGFGIAQRTILVGPASFTSEVSTGDAPVTVIEGAALNAFPGTQGVTVAGGDEIFLAYGRTGDVLAWIGDATYNEITFDVDAQKLVSKVAKGAEDTVPSAVDSDLWLQQYEGNRELTRRINVPDGISAIVTSNGTDPAPKNITITWPLDNSAPMAGPLIVGGIFALLLGLAVFLWALVHARRRRGPRRTQLRPPKAPQPPRLKRGKQPQQLTGGPGALEDGVGTSPVKSRGRRTKLIAASTLLVGSLALAGCTTGGASGSSAEPTPTSTAGVEQEPTAVTEQQLVRIMDEVTKTVAAADAAKDVALASTRLGGPALQLRTAGYAIETADSSIGAVTSIPEGTIQITLPQQNASWPRAVFAVVVPPDATSAPLAVVLEQETARDNYKVHYLIALEPKTVLPEVAPPQIGAVTLAPDNPLGLLAPDALADAYGDILLNDTASESNDLFSPEGDSLRTTLGAQYKADRKAGLPSTATIAYSHAPSTEDPISFPTNDSGQLVAVALDDTETVTPVEAGAAVNTAGAVKALSGKPQSTKGITATYGIQLLFYVPSITDKNAKIQLLGFTQGLTSASEVP